MKNIKNSFNINLATYFLILTFLLTGLIKNIILIYLIVIFHELGHIFIIKLLKYKIIRVDIYPMGGITTINKKINTPIKDEILISSFGVIFQVILYLLFFFLFNYGFINLNTFNLFKIYNKTIIIFNLLPIIPLDGYILLRSIIELVFPYHKAFYFSLFISIISIVFFITFNQIYSLNNYLIISFLIYKIIIAIKEFKYEHLKFLLERHLNNFKYHKIKYERNSNLNLLKKDTYHYFKKENTYISEKSLLKEKFFK
ncbi:MAG: hypothetical protein NC483_06280 [Ruminococcus sp.]|nr:hypothetical protein [Ruminococcus sp.]